MTTDTDRLSQSSGRLSRQTIPASLWNLTVAVLVALALCVLLQGRTLPQQAPLSWLVTYLLLFCGMAVWLFSFSHRLGRASSPQASRIMPALIAFEGPLAGLAAAISVGLYALDSVNHQITYYLQPTPMVIVLLAMLLTLVAQEMVLRRTPEIGWFENLSAVLAALRPWALPASLLLIGLLQGLSYIWVIGNDFTRYWAIADALPGREGYPVSVNLPVYQEGGMYKYSIELPFFPSLVSLGFVLFGHTTVGAYVPAVAANTTLPILLYSFYRKAGFSVLLSYAGAVLLATFPFLRLYTYNAPVPDAVFVTVLVATARVWLELIDDLPFGLRMLLPKGVSSRGVVETVDPARATAQHSGLSTRHFLTWPAFGLMAGITTLTRPEGMLFVAFMFLGLVPNLWKPRLYAAGFTWLAMVAAFAAFMMSTFGIPWPRNAGSSFGLENVRENLDWLYYMSLPWYARAYGVANQTFILATELFLAGALAGTLYMARRHWQWVVLPAASALHIFLVFTVDFRVSGVDQWFDFFRHLSYGGPLLLLPVLYLLSRLPGIASRNWLLASLLLLFSGYNLLLMSQPSRTYGNESRQLLTSDVWVTFSDVVAHPYQLPKVPYIHRDGVLEIDSDDSYMRNHLESVKRFYDPYSVLNTGKGGQYEFSTILVVLVGITFAAAATPRRFPGRLRAS